MQIDSIGGLGSIGTRGIAELIPNQQGAALPIPGEQSAERSFGQFLADALGDVNAAQSKSNDMVRKFATGAPLDIHEVMIAMEQASTALSLTAQVRNKLVDAYQEVMRTQI